MSNSNIVSALQRLATFHVERPKNAHSSCIGWKMSRRSNYRVAMQRPMSCKLFEAIVSPKAQSVIYLSKASVQANCVVIISDCSYTAAYLTERRASPRHVAHMHHLTFGINSLLHSVNLIVFTLLLVHLILRISLHHSHHLRSHHLVTPLTFHSRLKTYLFHKSFL